MAMERNGVERLLAGDAVPGEVAQLLVDEWQELVAGHGVGVEDPADAGLRVVRHGRSRGRSRGLEEGEHQCKGPGIGDRYPLANSSNTDPGSNLRSFSSALF